MIVVRLIGGLGNQLFQYALGRRLAYDRGVVLKLDISGFEDYKLHRYSLSRFAIRQNFADSRDLSVFTEPMLSRFERFVPMRCRSVVKERDLGFDGRVLKTLRQQVYLDGYWQSERYFKDIEDVLRAELEVVGEPDDENQATADAILRTNSVCVHIRRGDYVSNSETFRIHGVLPLDYYQRAAREISREVSAPHFFVFSDDPDWCRLNLSLDDPFTLVTHNRADRNFEDLRLMKSCKHHIIANSSFGWWGAWLADHERQIVIAPSNWYRDATRDTSDLIPPRWRKR